MYLSQKKNLISGGLIRGSQREQIYTRKMYEQIRNRRTDYLVVAKNTGFSIEQVQVIKNYLFKDYHYLNGSTMTSRFDDSYEIAESWRRLSERNGKNIQRHDVLLLYHELYEVQLLLSSPEMSQNMAHKLASMKYPYDRESEKYYRMRGQ